MRKWWLWNLTRAWLFALPLVLWNLPAKADNLNPQVAWTVLNTKCWADSALVNWYLPKNSWIWFLIEKEIALNYSNCFSEGQLKILKEITSDPRFLDRVEELRKENEWDLENLIKTLIFALIYLISYLPTVVSVYKWMPIRAFSFAWFATASAWSININWMVPWSVVYAETFLLAISCVLIHLNNKRIWKVMENPWVIEFLERNPLPTSKYNKQWKPIVWNKKMEDVTWYTHQEVLDCYEEHWEIMTLLYKWENLEKVKEYLAHVNTTWWYENVAFTMNKKNWDPVTLLWTTIPDWNWWTTRTAVELTDKEEIKRELEKTRRIVRSDEWTCALSKKAFKEDIHKLFTQVNRKWDPTKKIAVIIDLDGFKWVNDTLWHNVWDEVLVKFAEYIQSKIRWWDNFYRIWWDEFVIIFDNDDLDWVSKKINELREWFYNIEFPYDYINWNLRVWSSWWVKIFDVKDYYSSSLTSDNAKKVFDEEIKESADYYMYAVKYFGFILPELEERWLDLSKITEKNWQAYPRYDAEWNFTWVRVVKTWITFDLSVKELELIDTRKKEKADEIAKRIVKSKEDAKAWEE